MKNFNQSNMYPNIDELPASLKINGQLPKGECLIDGKSVVGDSWEPVCSPICYFQDGKESGYRLGEVPWLSQEEAYQALLSAEKGYALGMGSWPQLPVQERINHMKHFKDLMAKAEKDFTRLEMWEIAKTSTDCQDEFIRTLDYIEETINTLLELDDESNTVKKSTGYMAQIRRLPLGTSLIMGPFNYPLNETLAMLVPSLIMGNTAIVKLPRYGCLCYQPLLKSFQDAFPAGVINIISGAGEVIIPPIMQCGRIAVLGFIGSTGVARSILDQHPSNNRLRSILGLEAKNPAFVFPDCDLELAVNECVAGALDFNGQRCTAIKHIWVHRDIIDKFIEALDARIAELKCGLPWEDGVVITPLAEAHKCEKLLGWVTDAIDKGARIQNPGGGTIAGNLFYPTVLYPVKPGMDIYSVEQFGPLIPISSFSSLDEIAGYMRQSLYGQQASIFSSSVTNAAPLIDLLVSQVSRVNLNAQCRRGPDVFPFTGRKDSAEGTLSIPDALRSFSIRALTVANEQGKELFLKTLASQKSKFLRM